MPIYVIGRGKVHRDEKRYKVGDEIEVTAAEAAKFPVGVLVPKGQYHPAKPVVNIPPSTEAANSGRMGPAAVPLGPPPEDDDEDDDEKGGEVKPPRGNGGKFTKKEN